MPLIGTIISFLASTVGRYVLVGVGVVALVGGFAMRERNIGAAKAVAKIEKATDNAIEKGKRAAANSASPGVRGQRDPSTRDD